MKIGILTFHRAENVGAVLQAWALQQYLTNYKHVVLVVDYRCDSIEMTYDIFNPRLLWKKKNIFSSLKLYIERIKTFKTRRIKKELFANFRDEYLNLSSPVFKLNEIPECDLYITGSDQVWNLKLTNGYNKFYFLDFPAKHRLAYAASLERSSLNRLKKVQKDIICILDKFDGISVREEWVAEEVLSILPSIKVQVCIDPVFLLSSSEYLKLAKKPKKSKYILVYQVVESPLTIDIANRLSKKYSLPIINIHAQQKLSYSSDNEILGFGPQEFLGYVANAEYVITTSFHGLAFSIIFRKEFWVIKTVSSNRQKNLLDVCGIGNRLISSKDDFLDGYINYRIVDEKLSGIINSSKQFIKKYI